MIADYSELVAEVTERSKDSGVANRAKQYVGLAENMLSKYLRLAGMETSAELTTDANGDATLPTGYREMRSIRANNREIQRQPANLILAGHKGFYVQGKVLKSSYKDTAHQLVYYASLPSLEANSTSWLLDEEPELYLQAVLFQVYTANNDLERASVTRNYLDSLIADANQADFMNRYAGTRINPGHVL